MELKKNSNPEEQRLVAVELFIKALQTQPDLLGKGLAGEVIATKITNGADLLMKYILEGKKPVD